MDNFLDILRALFQIGVLAVIIYWLLRLLKVLHGISQGVNGVFILVILHFLTGDDVLKLPVIRWLLGKILELIPVAVIVLYREDIRRMFEQMIRFIKPGRPMLHGQQGYSQELVTALTASLVKLAGTKTGALVAVQQFKDLSPYCDTGKRIYATLTAGNAMLESIFYKGNPLHDGGVIIRKDKVEAASCVFPLCANEDIRDLYGMRHQAAFGMSEMTDALVLVVSEETGQIHVIYDKMMETVNGKEELKAWLQRFLKPDETAKTGAGDWLRKVSNRMKAAFRLFKKKDAAREALENKEGAE